MFKLLPRYMAGAGMELSETHILSWRHGEGTGTDQAAQSLFWSSTNHISHNSNFS